MVNLSMRRGESAQGYQGKLFFPLFVDLRTLVNPMRDFL